MEQTTFSEAFEKVTGLDPVGAQSNPSVIGVRAVSDEIGDQPTRV